MLPSAAAASKSRKSLLTPEMPKTPDFLFKMASTSSMVNPSLFIKKGMMAGSIEPERVPITKPSNGVKPMEVSTTLPFFTAAMDEPLPKWQVIIFSSSMGFPQSSAALWAT